MVKEIVWSFTAQKQLADAYEYILISSYQNAEKVKTAILASTQRLATQPEMHSLDKYRKDNDGSFRSYELHRYRIAYRVTKKNIIILRVRHTSMEPKSY